MKIKKAVIPVAGKGTRFLPATKEIPKEMIPLVDRPMIHYAVQEAISSGIEQVVLVTATGKESIERYFDRNIELELFLEKNGKHDELELIKNIGNMVEIVTVKQKEQLGLGHAVLCAKEVIGSDSFAVILGDDLVISNEPVTKQLSDAMKRHSFENIIGVMEVPLKDTSKYGIVDGDWLDEERFSLKLKSMIEKPLPENAPTNLATPGRYIFSSEIFECLSRIKRGVGGEYQLTDAIAMLAQTGAVMAHKFKGNRFDTGNIPAYLEATIEFAMANESTRSIMLNLLIEKSRKYVK
jgi:UTP--glucose-1-phosphate uridylyltransferase